MRREARAGRSATRYRIPFLGALEGTCRWPRRHGAGINIRRPRTTLKSASTRPFLRSPPNISARSASWLGSGLSGHRMVRRFEVGRQSGKAELNRGPPRDRAARGGRPLSSGRWVGFPLRRWCRSMHGEVRGGGPGAVDLPPSPGCGSRSIRCRCHDNGDPARCTAGRYQPGLYGPPHPRRPVLRLPI
jgi:hypothetical protein